MVGGFATGGRGAREQAAEVINDDRLEPERQLVDAS